MKSMLLYLEGSRCKVDNALCDLEGRARQNYRIMQFMRHQRDKEGLPQTILKVWELRIFQFLLDMCNYLVISWAF